MAENKLDALHKEALERFSVSEQSDSTQRILAIEDMLFAHSPDGQWEESATEKRKDRPKFTINKLAGAINQIVGDQRQNRTDIKCSPVSGGASEDIAEVMSGLIRNIEAQSKASNIYDAAFDESLGGGYGGWRVITEYSDDDVFAQDIKIRPIRSSASSLYFDPAAEDYDKRDANWAFLLYDMQTEDFKKRYKDATINDFAQLTNPTDHNNGWFRSDSVRVAEYWVKEPYVKTVVKLSDGRVIDLDEDGAVIDELASQGVTVEKTRKINSHKVVMYLMSGGEILKGPMAWAGKYIPLIPLYGRTVKIEDRTYISGLVRNAKDPSRIYNYATSAAVEATALSPKDPIWMTKAQAAGHEKSLSTFNTSNSPFMFYNADPLAPGTPIRTGAPSVQAAILQQIMQAGQDIEATTGIYAPALGNAPQLLSEKSVMAQAEKGDRGSFIYTDNLHKSIQYTGEILVDLIPKIYDTPRMMRILHIDGKSEEVDINKEELDSLGQPVIDTQSGKVVMVNDLTMGKYDVSIEAGPSFNTQRQEAAQQLIDLATGSPLFEQLATDLIAKNLNIRDNEELTKRVRRMMIKQGLVEPTEEEAQEMGLNKTKQPDPSEEALLDNVHAQTALSMANVANKDADTLTKRIKAQQETAKTMQIIVESIIKKAEAGFPLTTRELSLLIKQTDIVAEGQDDLDPGPNSEQRADIAQNLSSLRSA